MRKIASRYKGIREFLILFVIGGLLYLAQEKTHSQRIQQTSSSGFLYSKGQELSQRVILAKKLYEEAQRQQDLENIKQSFSLYKKARDLFQTEKDERGLLYCDLGILHLEVLLENFDEIDQKALFCLEKSRDLKDFYGECESLMFFGMALRYQKEGNQAEDYFLQALEKAGQHKFQKIVVWALYELAESRQLRGDFSQASKRLEEALKVAKSMNDQVSQVRILKKQSDIAFLLDDFTKARKLLEEAEKLAKKTHKKIEEANILKAIGILGIKRGHYNEAVVSIQQSLMLFAQLNLEKSYAKTHRHLCVLHDEMGEDAEAKSCFAEALKEIKEKDDNESTLCLISSGRFERRRSNYEEAKKFFHEALEYAKRQKNIEKEGDIYFELATIERRKGNFEDARHYYNQAAALARQLKNKKKFAKILCGLGALEFFMNNYTEAEENFTKALHIGEKLRSENLKAYVYLGFGSIKYIQGYYTDARKNLLKAHDIYKKIQKKSGQAKTLFRLGQVETAQGKYDEASNLFDKSLLFLQQIGRIDYQLRIFLEKGEIEFCRGNNQKAKEYFQRASNLNQKSTKYIEARSLMGQALIAAREGETKSAVEMLNQSIEILRLLKEQIALARGLMHLALLEYHSGRVDSAQKFLAEALVMTQEVNDQQGQACILNEIGFMDIALGYNNKAQKCFEQSLNISQKIGYKRGECITYIYHSTLCTLMGSFKKSQGVLNKAQRLALTLGEPDLNGLVLLGISKLEFFKGFFGRSRSAAEQALSFLKIAKNQAGITRAIRYLGDVENASNGSAEPKHAYEKALQQATQINNFREKAFSLLCLGKMSIKHDEIKAKKYLEEALELCTRIQCPYGKALTFRELSFYEKRWGTYKRAEEYLSKAALIFKELQYKAQKAITLVDLGCLYRSMGYTDQAKDCYEEALAYLNNEDKERLERRESLLFKLKPGLELDADSIEVIDESLSKKKDTEYDYLRAIINYEQGKVELIHSNAVKAIEYLNNAAELFEKADDILWLIKTFKKIGKAETILKNFTAAEFAYRKSLNFAQFRENLLEEEEILGELALMFALKEDFASASKYFERYKNLFSTSNAYDDLKQNLLAAEYYQITKKGSLSRASLEKALDIAQQIKKRKSEAEIYVKLASFADNQEQHQELSKKGNAIFEAIGCITHH